MPRHNNRKRYPNEGKLGFNPEKYISKPGERPRHHSNYSPVQLAQRVSYEPRPAQNRHKARSLTRKKRRAMEEVRRMQQTAERVRIPARRRPAVNAQNSASQPVQAPAYTVSPHPTLRPTCAPDAHTCAPDKSTTITNAQPTSIFGGIKEWLKRTILHG